MHWHLHWLTLLFSLVFGLRCVWRIRTYDLLEKEPWTKMIVATIWGGIWSIVISLMLYRGADIIGFEIGWNWTGALLGIGPIEEFGKLAAFFSCYFFIRKELNEPVDGMIYMACVALGFSLIENYFYAVNGASADYELLVTRSLICTPVHMLFSVFMGFGAYAWLRMGRGAGLLFTAFLMASVAHGLYDGILIADLGGWTWPLLIALLLLLALTDRSFLEYCTAISPMRRSLAAFVDASEGHDCSDRLECPNCGSRNPETEHRVAGHHIRFQKCGRCECYVARKVCIKMMFRYFGPGFRRRRYKYRSAASMGKKFATLQENNFIAEDSQRGYFRLAPLSETLEGIVADTIRAMQSRWWFPALYDLQRNDAKESERCSTE